MRNAGNVPDTLKNYDQWICWKEQERRRQSKPTKAPIYPTTGRYASVADPDTWTSFSFAYREYLRNDDLRGIGYVFTDDDPYLGVDLDDCRDPDTGALDQWAKEVIRNLNSYTEASPSGTGVHVILQASKPHGKHRDGSIEVYDTDRYFTVTGRHLDLTPASVEPRQGAIDAVHTEYLEPSDPDRADQPPPEPPTDLSDDELIDRAKNASNGDNFQRLWNGNTDDYPSHSEADQALCNMLAFWTGGDAPRVERLFEQSGLVRDKWRERKDYRERTIQKAIQDCPAYYSP